MTEWPEERRRRLEATMVVSRRLSDVPAELFEEIESKDSFRELVDQIIDAQSQDVDRKTQIAELSNYLSRPETFGDYDETTRDAALALACVAALRKTPTHETWQYLWSLAWHSSSLAEFLPEAVIRAATDDVFKNEFSRIARIAVEEANQNPGRRAISREKHVGPGLKEQWRQRAHLSTLWRGNFGNSTFPIGSDDDHVLAIMADIDLSEFVHLLSLYDYPDPVAHALMWCGAPWRFSRWTELVTAAPEAFQDDGQWTGSLILPLLLAFGHGQFQFPLRAEASDEQVLEATLEIQKLAKEVAQAIARRDDAQGCMTRWGNWLVRSEIPAVSANLVPHPTNAASQGFTDDALLEALIAEMPEKAWKHSPTPDAESWEPWCHLALGALVALAGKTSIPELTDFLYEWVITPEGWQEPNGQTLKLRAVPFEIGGPKADGYGGRLLAVPMVEAAPADEQWRRFWGSTIVLREIAEFGDADETTNGGWDGRSDAGRLLMLQFNIGLMMLDHLIGPPRELTYDRSSAIGGLLPSLYDAVREMAAIDQLNLKFWSAALRHLAIRRARWISTSASGASLLDVAARPTLSDFVQSLAGDTENLLSLAYVAEKNEISRAEIAGAFEAADVDIGAEIAIAERLISISPRAIGLDQQQLDNIRRNVQAAL